MEDHDPTNPSFAGIDTESCSGPVCPLCGVRVAQESDIWDEGHAIVCHNQNFDEDGEWSMRGLDGAKAIDEKLYVFYLSQISCLKQVFWGTVARKAFQSQDD